MDDKLRKRGNQKDSSTEESLNNTGESPGDEKEDTSKRTNRNGSSSEELEYLEVKHVVLILLFVFALFFTGTYMFFNAINSTNSFRENQLGNKENHFVSSDNKPFSEKFSDGNTATKGNQQQSEANLETLPTNDPKELDLPTILWWTDMLYPHMLSGRGEKKIECDIGTCYSTNDKSYLPASNTRGIMFYGTDFRAYEAPLPRQKWHEWALLHEESPMNNYILSHAPMLRLFNHTGTYGRESHFPITTHSLPSLEYLTERQPVPLAAKNRLRGDGSLAPIVYVQSHCNVASDRDSYVQELMKYVDIDSYGECLNNKKLPQHLRDPVQSMFSPEFYDSVSKYKFHLAFENAICDDYVTEKFFRPFHLGSVPIHMGSSSARDWAPDDHSMINTDDFGSAKELAEFIIRLDNDDAEYEKYLDFKKSGVQNRLLIETMKNRNWEINEWGRHSFITAFECHVCDKIYERWTAERRHARDPSVELPPVRTGEYKHLGCPVPFVSVGKLDDRELEDEYVI
ncbi:putative alpha-(1,3)-fucosyltransferase 11-like [Apostichopus japonicus]|uniref:Fucosyltransferase n=1 Tax=Stichopus japonicus TaxID=307972 RepID=A0A2G8KS07_STIJA|nr:putative alpha-(1,3)-fucosyltransferase 11-like [Apostichopus japonicus]